MGKLDEIKEILNTLRVAMSIVFGILVVTIAGIVKRVDANLVDTLFWVGVIFAIILMAVIRVIILKISKKTREIGEIK
jgi:hypothetical protein